MRILLLLAGLLAALSDCMRLDNAPAPKAIDGVIDLRQWDFRVQGPVQLNGMWEVRWKQLPGDPRTPGTMNPRPPAYLHVPGSWTGETVDGVELPEEGYATYWLRVLIAPGQVPLAVRTESASTAFELRVDGRPIAGNGTVGTSAETSRPEFRNALTALPPLPASSEWTLTVSNFHYRKGGPWFPVELGSSADLIAKVRGVDSFGMFVIGSLVIMGLYHLVLFALRRKDPSPLYFGLFCLVGALRQASAGDRHLRLLWDAIPFGVLTRIEFITFYLFIVMGGLFAAALFPAEFSRRLIRIVVLVGATSTALTLVLPLRWSSHLINPYQYWSLGICAYYLWALIRAARNRREGARAVLAGASVLVAAGTNDVLYNLEIFQYDYLFSFGLVVFNFAQSLMLSRRFVHAMFTVEALQGALEVKVVERTAELAAKNQELVATIEDLRTTRSQLRQVGLSLRIGPDYVVIPYSDLQYLTAEGGKTVIHTREKAQEVPRPLKEIEALLSDEVFQRIHRQCIVNLSWVANIAHIGNGTYIAVLRGHKDSSLPVSRVYAPALRQRLGIGE